MTQRNTVFLSLLLGVGLSLAPLRAQDTPQKPPSSEQAQSVFTGNLVDADCRMHSPGNKCEVTETTVLFGLQTGDNKFYRFDEDSNTKVLTALKSASKKTGPLNVSVNGSASGETMKVSTIEIR